MFVYESLARSRASADPTIEPWSKAVAGSASTGCQAVSSGSTGSRSAGISPR